MSSKNQISQMNQDVVIRFTKVDFSHPNGFVALHDVDLVVRRGEIVSILGTNGAGKSTLVRHMNGLLKPSHGTVEILGMESKSSSAAQLSKKVGIVFQNPNNQLFAQSVRSEIEFGLKNFGFAGNILNERIEWALKTFSLTEYEEKSPMELSGGEKKRLCIALVLAWDPEILILDEPTVGQDFIQKAKLRDTVHSLSAAGKTVILVTHDVEFVWPMQPRVILMSEGKIVADGEASEVLGDKSRSASANVLQPQLVELFNFIGIAKPYPRDEFEARDRIRNHFQIVKA